MSCESKREPRIIPSHLCAYRRIKLALTETGQTMGGTSFRGYGRGKLKIFIRLLVIIFFVLRFYFNSS